jgi:hypothetical protein
LTTGSSWTRRGDVVTENTIFDGWAACAITVDGATDTVASAIAGVSAAAFTSLVSWRRSTGCSIPTLSAVSATATSGEIIAYGTIIDVWAAAAKTGDSTAITVSTAAAAATGPLAVRVFCRLCIGK